MVHISFKVCDQSKTLDKVLSSLHDLNTSSSRSNLIIIN